MADNKLRVGPVASGSYVYRIGNRMSESKYANAESARADGCRPQRVNAKGNLEPDVDETLEINDFDGAIPFDPYPTAI